MTTIRRIVGLLAGIGAALWGDTTVNLGTYAVVQGEGVDVRVAVACPVLKELQVTVQWDDTALQLDPAGHWVNPARIYQEEGVGKSVSAETFITVLGPQRVQFWLQKTAEIGAAGGWRVSAQESTGAEVAVFGFRLLGQLRGTHGLSFAAAFPPVARNTNVFHPEEPLTAVAGTVLVYLAAGPVQIAPTGGAFNHALEVAVSSANATRLVYTLDGSAPGVGSTELPTGQALFLDGDDGQQVRLQVLAFGEAGPTQSAQANFRFDLAAPTVAVTALATAAGRPPLAGTVSDPAAAVTVTVAGGTSPALNHGDGTWSLDLASVFGADLAEGVYDVTAVATDEAGNSAVDPTSGELTVDRTSPQGAFSVGAGGPAYLSAVETSLIIAVTGAAEMRFRNGGDDWGAWTGYQATLAWSLPAGDGAKTVQGEFRDAALNLLGASDSVVLDTGLPVSDIAVAGTYGPLTWPGELSGTATDGLSGVARVEVQCVRSDSGAYWTGTGWSAAETWVTASGTALWGLELEAAALPGEVGIAVRSRSTDRAGNVQSPVDETTFEYDATAPAGTFSIAAPGTVAVALGGVTLNSAVTGATQMRFREGTGAWTAWLSFSATHAWTLALGDGLKTVSAAFRDGAGNTLDALDDVLLDQALPVSVVSTAGGYGPTSWSGFVSGTATDATSGVAGVDVRISRLPVAAGVSEYWDGATWVATEQWLPATLGGLNWTVVLPLTAVEAGGDGRRYAVTARARDLAGNAESTGGTAEFLFDSQIPAGGFTIGMGNPLYLNVTSVTLDCKVEAEHPVEMRFRNEGEAFPGSWAPFAASLSFTLPSGNGLKTVYGEFRDTVSLNTLATSDTVTLDRDAPMSTPTLAGAFGPLSWPGALTGSASDTGPAGMERVDVTVVRSADGRYWNGSDWQAASVLVAVSVVVGLWTLPLPAGALGDGAAYFVSSQAVDRAGNQQAVPAQTTIQYDSSAPLGTFSIGFGGPPATAAREVTLAISVSGAADMSFRNAGGAWSEWEPLAVNRVWQLTGGDGSKQVSGRFRDTVGNTLETADTILYDSTPPTAALVSASAYGPASWPGQVAGTATDGLSGVGQVQVRLQRSGDGFFWNGSGWVGSEGWLVAVGTTPWHVALAASAFSSGSTYTVTARAVDAAGNTQEPAAVGAFLYDAGLPQSVVSMPAQMGPVTWPGGLGGTASDALSGVSLVSVRLRRVLGGSVSYWNGTDWELDNDTLWLPAAGALVWHLAVPLAALVDGASYTASSRAVDGVGNVQTPLTSQSFTYDGAAPTLPTLTGITTDTGVAGDLVTSDRTLVLAGLAEAGATVEVRLDGAVVGSVQSSVGGVWSLDHTSLPIAVGAHALELAAVDGAGNRSAWSAPRVVTVDTVAPALTCGLVAGSRLNGSATIGFTTDGNGTVEASVDQLLWVAVQSGTSTLGAVPGFAALAQGSFTLALRDTDLAGNEGRVQVALIKDTSAPAGYAATISQTRINAANRHALTFVLNGAEAGTTCDYFVADDSRAVLSGSFAVTAATQVSPAIDVSGLTDGTIRVEATLRDVAGNRGLAAVDEVLKDVVLPAGYSVHFDAAYVNASTQTLVTFTLTAAEPGTTCNYSLASAGGGSLVTGSFPVVAGTVPGGPVNVSGLSDGVLTLSVILVDSFGNQGTVALAQGLKDVVAPAPPQVDTWTTPVTLANAAAFSLAGRGEALSTVLFQVVPVAGGDPVTGSAAVGADGRFALSATDLGPLADGTLTLRASGRDPAGNQTGFATVGTILKDTLAPAAPTLSAFTATVNSETVAQFAFAGSAGPGVRLDYALLPVAGSPPELLGSLIVGALGNFSVSALSVAALPDGVLELRLTARDEVGNTSPACVGGPIIKDTLAPALALVSPAVGGSLSGDEVLVLAASDAIAFQVSFDGTTWFPLQPGITPFASLPPFAGLKEGWFTLGLTATDSVGNDSTANLDYVKDTLAPAGYSVAMAAAFVDAGAVSELAFSLSGGEIGSTYAYELRDEAPGRGQVAGSGSVTQATQEVAGVLLADLEQGTLTLTLRLTDAAGNVGAPVTAQTFLGTTAIVALVPGWNAFGVVVVPLDSAAAVRAEALGRADGAVLAGPFYEYVGGVPSAVPGPALFQCGRAYRVFARQAGTLRLRGRAGSSSAALASGWNFVAPVTDALVSAFAGGASAWSDPRPGVGYRRLSGDTLVRAGEPLWLHLAP